MYLWGKRNNMTHHSKPLILVTNDDGVKAGGIAALINMVKDYGDVVVVAPNQAQSGMSHAITVKVPLYYTCIQNSEGLTIYKSNGTPVDCVKLALNKILHRQPDICVSGINHGSNSSNSVHYSGTMGGAREAALYGVPAIGFSLLSYDPDADFTSSVAMFKRVFEHALENRMPQGTYLNVNAPDGNSLKGIRIVRQAQGRWIEEFIEREDPRGKKYFWLTGHFQNDEPEATDTDEYALENGYVSVVPCQTDITHYHSVNRLTSLNYENL
jgi:5'-nucleotidase